MPMPYTPEQEQLYATALRYEAIRREADAFNARWRAALSHWMETPDAEREKLRETRMHWQQVIADCRVQLVALLPPADVAVFSEPDGAVLVVCFDEESHAQAVRVPLIGA
jgi:hypothetical protein